MFPCLPTAVASRNSKYTAHPSAPWLVVAVLLALGHRLIIGGQLDGDDLQLVTVPVGERGRRRGVFVARSNNAAVWEFE